MKQMVFRRRSEVSRGARLHHALRMVTLLLMCAAPAAAQYEVPLLEGPAPEIPFVQWMAEGDIEQIDWRCRVTRPQLSIVQRLFVELQVAVNLKRLRKGSGVHEFWVTAGVRDSRGIWLSEQGAMGARLEQIPPKVRDLNFTMQVMFLPGEYTLGVVLYDRVSGKRSVTLRSLKVRALTPDPLPDAFRDEPRVEFLQTSATRNAAPAQALGRLWLPAPTRQPLEVDFIVNFSSSEEYAGRADFHRKNVATMLGLLIVLSQIYFPNGRVNVTAVDLARRRVIFEQADARAVDWTRLRQAVYQLSPYAVRARDLAERRQHAAFLREVLARKLADIPAPRESMGAANGSKQNAAPLRVVFFVSSLMQVARGSDLQPFEPPARRPMVYFLRYQISPGNVFDDLGRILERLEPRRFQMDSPMAFRRALARILAELREL